MLREFQGVEVTLRSGKHALGAWVVSSSLVIKKVEIGLWVFIHCAWLDKFLDTSFWIRVLGEIYYWCANLKILVLVEGGVMESWSGGGPKYMAA